MTSLKLFQIPQRYRFSSKSQQLISNLMIRTVVLDTTKVQIFKQITTKKEQADIDGVLFQIPQRYRFSSKSQPERNTDTTLYRCFRYHKGTDFQANHNTQKQQKRCQDVVLDTTKVQIFKQITTVARYHNLVEALFQIPQRYRFSSKSQLLLQCDS